MSTPTPPTHPISYVAPDPAKLPGEHGNNDGKVGERFASLTPAQRAAAGIKSEDGYVVQMHDPVNEPNISKHANQSWPV